MHPMPEGAAARVRQFRNGAVQSLSQTSPWIWIAVGAVVLMVVGFFVARHFRSAPLAPDEDPA